MDKYGQKKKKKIKSVSEPKGASFFADSIVELKLFIRFIIKIVKRIDLPFFIDFYKNTYTCDCLLYS